jgi:uncharacterized 2Fe-2S/4Fe-4S cluster protein (DUF4445 family)
MSDNKYRINLLPHGRQIDVKPGISLMEALMEQSIFLRSDCGGKGVCKKCRVKIFPPNGNPEFKEACGFILSEDISIEIPESSMLSSHIITKAPASLPKVFTDRFKNIQTKDAFGIAVDLGTTTIAIYLCNTTQGKVLSSLAVKNPQALYGDDVMSRIGAIGQDKKNLGRLQKLVVRAIEWGIKELLKSVEFKDETLLEMVTVGNPTMIHIFAGIDPKSIGISPYEPEFYEARHMSSKDMGFAIKEFPVQLLPQVSGFIGGDILSAALAVDLENQPQGTLLVDLGTNGELMLKGKDGYFATSCATGPAFEGATLSCGMQAIPGAINKVKINGQALPQYTFVNPSNSSGLKPSGICGTGVISAVAQFCKKEIIALNGAFNKETSEKKEFVLVPENLSANGSDVFISQKDIRSVQLGKAALITGIEFLLKEAGFDSPEKIIIAGAFGTFLDKQDMMTLGMIPDMNFEKVEVAGNSAGAGAIMTLCDHTFLEKAIHMATQVIVVDLACNQDFQDVFIKRLSFPSGND